ncbi:[FeFe] hydrogenase H-cluster radical SAM maturase HydG [Fusibacter paucivorans]|nr:[FeFe] hydrogenase H-cluster radical SAM maturase HydG [Fusibacter paucivorans]
MAQKMEGFIDHALIYQILEETKAVTDEAIEAVLSKTFNRETLSYRDVAVLLQAKKPAHIERIYKRASEIKSEIYGNRVVMFAPLYVSNFCINNCSYCGYKRNNQFTRKKLTKAEIQEEVRILEKMGHKRIALEAGEDPVNCDIDYITDTIKTIYETVSEKSNIRRINVNIAATTVENYQKLKASEIGTYILFQETYEKSNYEKLHPHCPKGDYLYHLTAFDRAMQGGIDDVGAGVLFGFSDHRFEVLALMMHNKHLEDTFGVGFHTISVPRIKPAEGVDLSDYAHILDDETFKKIVAILRLAVPFTGIILSTRESEATRNELIHHGVTQLSAGSCTGVGGYKANELGNDVQQFAISDDRPTIDVIKGLIRDGFIPSFCTSCYRMGRTGDRFMKLAKTGEIQHVCQPNAMMTLKEYAIDYGDEELQTMADAFIASQLTHVKTDKTRNIIIKGLEDLSNGKRDIFL